MSGCFGDSQEDRSRERELLNYLDAQDEDASTFEACVDSQVASLLQQCTTHPGAYALICHEDFFLNELPELLALAANAHLAGFAQPDRQARLSALGQDVIRIFLRAITRLATHQVDAQS